MLIRELEQQGNWLFRRRSYVPLILLPFALLALYWHRGYLFGEARYEFYYGLFCLAVSLSGVVVRGMVQGWAQAGTSGRNTQGQAAENLNTRGLYSIIRHPLYLGNLLMVLGLLLCTKSLFLAATGVLFYTVFYERIMAAEEGFLAGKFGDSFTAWAARTPAFWPRFSQWQKPLLPFSWRAAIKGEFYGFTSIAAIMLVLDLLKNWFAEGRIGTNLFWLVLFAISIPLFFILRYLRKHTAFFEVKDRQEITRSI